MDILIDTNFILTCVKQKIDLFSQLKELFGNPRILIPKQVLWELEKLKNNNIKKIKDRESAKLALDIIKKNQIFILNLETNEVDAGIVRYANVNEVLIATLDKELKKKIKNAGVNFLTIRQKKRIIKI